jgi:hypothetical protein
MKTLNIDGKDWIMKSHYDKLEKKKIKIINKKSRENWHLIKNNMNKQQLAAKIWESANQMRSKIEANEYKDYILGFIFYKYLSDKQLQFTKKQDFSDEDIKKLSEGDVETVEYIKKI